MAEYKERSGLFKFFYIILRVITFPFFVVLYVLKHPVLMFVLLLVMTGIALYFPLSEGKTMAEAPAWYKSKYTEVRIKAVKNLAASGRADFLSEEFKQELKKEAEEADRYKGENYNQKIVRENKIEEKTAELKKRGGFKRKSAESKGEVSAEDIKENILNQSSGAVGGLASVLKDYHKKADEEVEHEPKTASETEPAEIVINENILPTPLKEDVVQKAAPKETQPSFDSKNDTDLDEFDLF